MNQRLMVPPGASPDPVLATPTSGCAALAAMSPLAARTVLRCSAAWDLLGSETQACLLRRVSGGHGQ